MNTILFSLLFKSISHLQINRNKKQKGQVIIFLILTFQVLFILLAMLINIGFVIHDKINLQNSVDLGAIYAAQKQAEILDAMAHINYQIRQSYKLLAWRYLVLGQLGANWGLSSTATANHFINSGNEDQLSCSALMNSCATPNNCDLNQINDIQKCPTATCMWHPQWRFNNVSNEHICQKLTPQGTTVTLPTWNTNIPPFVIGYDSLRNIIESARSTIERRCDNLGKLNWIIASSFLYQFRFDQWQRKQLIEDLFQMLVNQEDLDGNKIQDGVFKTIKNNLSTNNKDVFDERFLSMHLSTDGKQFTDFFKWNQIVPILFYIDSNSTSSPNNLCPSVPKPLFIPPNQLSPIATSSTSHDLHQLYVSNFIYINQNSSINPYIQNAIPLMPDSVVHNTPWLASPLYSGFYKKPSANPIGVRIAVSLPYKGRIFSPFSASGSTLMKAVAYAKPFGAKFGPQKDDDSRLLPLPETTRATLANTGTFITYGPLLKYRPNYSKYPGDRYGLLSKQIQYEWTKKIVENATPNADGRTLANYEVRTPSSDPMVQKFTLQTNGYAVSNLEDTWRMKIREYEELAIAPDIFDLTYYTILPNYMATLYLRIQKNTGIGGKVINVTGFIPGDLGDFKTFSQFQSGRSLSSNGGGFRNCFRWFQKDENQRYILSNNNPYIENQTNCVLLMQNDPLTQHKVKDIHHLLTSWIPPSSLTNNNYNQNDLMNCRKPDTLRKDKPHLLSHHCLEGGRSGFSVKLISKECYQSIDCNSL